jgi:hypothetical protein
MLDDAENALRGIFEVHEEFAGVRSFHVITFEGREASADHGTRW